MIAPKHRRGWPAGRPRHNATARATRLAELTRCALLVRQAREQLGEPATDDCPAIPLTQAQLAQMLGRSRSLVASWEQGERLPGAGDLREIEQMVAAKAASKLPDL